MSRRFRLDLRLGGEYFNVFFESDDDLRRAVRSIHSDYAEWITCRLTDKRVWRFKNTAVSAYFPVHED